MAVIILVGIMALLVAIATVSTKVLGDADAQRRRLFLEWHAAAESVGLRANRFSDSESRAQGVLQGVPVHATLNLEKATSPLVYRSFIWAKSVTIPAHLALQRDSTLRSVTRWMEGDDVPIGDTRFDELVELPALDAHVCAALNHQARAQLAQLLAWGVYVENSRVLCSSTWSIEQNGSLAALLRKMASLARLLSIPPGQLPQRLADNALSDPAPDVRLRNLRYLVAPSTQAPPELVGGTAASLLGDVYPPIRLLAAEHSGVTGHAVLRALAADGELELGLRVQAAQSLARPPSPDLEGLRAVLVESNPHEVVCAALSVIDAASTSCPKFVPGSPPPLRYEGRVDSRHDAPPARSGPMGQSALGPSSTFGETLRGSSDKQRVSPTSVPLFQAVLGCTQSEHESVRAAAARALGALARPETEPLLIGLLSDGSLDVQQASAEALGLFARVAAVEPLLPLAEGLVRPRLRQAARGAIGRIQSRLDNVEAGRLSLSDPNDLAGAVGLADAPAAVRAGEVSLVDEEPPEPLARTRHEHGVK